MQTPTSKMPKTLRMRYLGLLLALMVGLAACASIEGVAGTTPAPEVSVTGPFERGEDGTFVGTVNDDRVTISGEQRGVERLRFKLNETEWIDAELTPESYAFPVEGLQEGSNTVAIRVDGEDGSVTVIVIVIILDPGSGGLPAPVADPNPQDMVALGEVNNLVFFNSADPENADTLVVSNLQGSLLGIDYRPADGLLYGLTSTNTLYTIDTDTGVATEVSTLSETFEGRARSGVDFNPVPDALRITGANNQNFRVNPDTGDVTLDGELAFVEGDTNEGLNPTITASAYTNSFDGAEETELFNIDSMLNALVLQDPPNDGGLQTRGPLGINFSAVGGFDIFTAENGVNLSYAVSDAQLYTVDLATGGATLRGTIGSGNTSFQGLAVMLGDARAPGNGDNGDEDPDPRGSDLIGLTGDNTLVFFNSSTPGSSDTLEVSNVSGTLLAIDFRPATGDLVGLASSNRLYTIDVETGSATQISRLDERFESGGRSGLDFNPTVDRLRITGANGQNFRVNVDTGEVTVDGELGYLEGDENEGTGPTITASAYTNSFDGAEETELFNIDSMLNALVLQDPPNDGGLQTTGELGVDFGNLGGFDIVTGEDGGQTAFALTNSELYRVDLETGAATSLGNVMDADYRGLAAVLGSD